MQNGGGGRRMRLIDADALPYDEFLNHRIVMWEDIERSKTIDAVPVVRCKDCKYVIPYESGGFNCLTCPNVDRDVDENWFCAYGERKTEVEE